MCGSYDVTAVDASWTVRSCAVAVLVVGGAGYIGSVTARAFLRDGRDVIVLDDLSSGFREAVPAGAAFVQGSTHDPGLVERVVAEGSVDAAIHFAAKKSVAESMTQPGRYFAENVGGSNSLFDALARAGVERIVFSSSAAVYGAPEHLPLREDGPARPESPYGESKLMVEQMLRWYATCHGVCSVSLRYFNAAGATDDGECGESFAAARNLIPVVMKALLGRSDPMQIFGTDYPTRDGTCVRDYIHVEDLAAAHVNALGYLERGGTTTVVNVGTAQGSTVWEVVRAAESATGLQVPHTIGQRRPGDPAESYADITRARDLLGWEPRRSLQEILASDWRWRQHRPDGFAG
jgi:UDP-glucose-4-epimerase GalE